MTCFLGLLLPISFFPGWAQGIMKYLPFQGISYIPSMIFTKGFSHQQAIEALGQQLYLGCLVNPACSIALDRSEKTADYPGGLNHVLFIDVLSIRFAIYKNKTSIPGRLVC